MFSSDTSKSEKLGRCLLSDGSPSQTQDHHRAGVAVYSPWTHDDVDYTLCRPTPANTKHLYNICTTSAQRLRLLGVNVCHENICSHWTRTWIFQSTRVGRVDDWCRHLVAGSRISRDLIPGSRNAPQPCNSHIGSSRWNYFSLTIFSDDGNVTGVDIASDIVYKWTHG